MVVHPRVRLEEAGRDHGQGRPGLQQRIGHRTSVMPVRTVARGGGPAGCSGRSRRKSKVERRLARCVAKRPFDGACRSTVPVLEDVVDECSGRTQASHFARLLQLSQQSGALSFQLCSQCAPERREEVSVEILGEVCSIHLDSMPRRPSALFSREGADQLGGVSVAVVPDGGQHEEAYSSRGKERLSLSARTHG